MTLICSCSRSVAPFAGAWIEIQYSWLKKTVILSLPSRERGLKSRYFDPFFEMDFVAPFAGAWIEIARKEAGFSKAQASLPSRERGLKSLPFLTAGRFPGSLPSRERGLKCRS